MRPKQTAIAMMNDATAVALYAALFPWKRIAPPIITTAPIAKPILAFLNSLLISSDKTFLQNIKHQAKQGQQAPEVATDERPFLRSPA